MIKVSDISKTFDTITFQQFYSMQISLPMDYFLRDLTITEDEWNRMIGESLIGSVKLAIKQLRENVA